MGNLSANWDYNSILAYSWILLSRRRLELNQSWRLQIHLHDSVEQSSEARLKYTLREEADNAIGDRGCKYLAMGQWALLEFLCLSRHREMKERIPFLRKGADIWQNLNGRSWKRFCCVKPIFKKSEVVSVARDVHGWERHAGMSSATWSFVVLVRSRKECDQWKRMWMVDPTLGRTSAITAPK